MRAVVVVVDASESTLQVDLPPSRLHLIISELKNWCTQFLDQNPISQLAVIATKDARAHILTSLGDPLTDQLAALDTLLESGSSGEPSLQHCIDGASTLLSLSPSYCTKEILLVFSSLTTRDPGDVLASIDACAAAGVVCNVIHLSAGVRVMKRVAQKTNGSHNVMLDKMHLTELFQSHIAPPPLTVQNTDVVSLLMGFPSPYIDAQPVLCACHKRLSSTTYKCPRCSARVCELPTKCPVCTLTLVSSSHMARSYHHLFPLPAFICQAAPPNESCSSCGTDISGNEWFVCGSCNSGMCGTCESFVQQSLFTCPNC